MRRLLALAALLCLLPGASLGQDAAAGEKTFKQCGACHAVGENAKNKVGPVLNGVFGRQAGTLEGFSYSKAMVEAGAGGLVWTPETVAQFIHKPKDLVPGTKMTFAGTKTDADAANVVAYLLTFSPDYVP